MDTQFPENVLASNLYLLQHPSLRIEIENLGERPHVLRKKLVLRPLSKCFEELLSYKSNLSECGYLRLEIKEYSEKSLYLLLVGYGWDEIGMENEREIIKSELLAHDGNLYRALQLIYGEVEEALKSID